MKRARKLITFILAAVMVMSMSLNAWAAGETGTITITNAKEGTTYSVYKILDLVSLDQLTGAYSYKVTDNDWKTFLATQNELITVDANDYVTWKGEEGSKAEDAADFAAAAIEYVKAEKLAPTKSVTADADGNLPIDDLEWGYYLVDSGAGVLCFLDTSDGSAVEIAEKNEVPVLDKKVDGTATTNTASIGTDVSFTVTITVKELAQNYTLHDTMSAGLTYDPNSLKVKIGNETVDVANYTYKYANAADPNNKTEHCTFEVFFDDDYLATLAENTVITVTYTAELNENAVVGDADDSVLGNTNTAYLAYGEQPDKDGNGTPDGEPPKTPEKTTTTYTYSFDLVKTDNNGKVLNGAEFEIYDASTGGNKINLVNVSSGVYRVATQDEATAQDFTSAVITAGNVEIVGLGNGTYWLEETNPPDGYNPLSARKSFTITDANLDATVNDGTYDNGGVQVINNTGSELPSTGGIGTTIFYIVGGVLVVFAVVLLVTKKRMKNEE